jgi:hypothetical protein
VARIRTIKPEFFTSEDIVNLSPLARLLYIALWCEADKRGRMTWKPKTFKMRWLPGDRCDITVLCGELVASGLVELYDDELAFIPGFEKHQHVNPREKDSDLPDPDGWKDPGPRKVGKNLREAVFERDGYKCVRCESDDHIQADHILPQSIGGPHCIENLRTLCRSCNAGRPVSGPALDADLAKDGLTLEILRAKFGIDASILDVHAQVGREGKGREGKERVASRDALFDSFWEAYPRKVAKQDAAKAFEKLAPDADLSELILSAIRVQSSSEAWTKDGGKFIPHAATWINGKRWMDDAGTHAPGDPQWFEGAI